MTARRGRARRSQSSKTGFGLTAVVAMVMCCALPAVISAGVLATIGGVLRNPLIIAAAVVVLGVALAYARRRLRRGQTCSELPDRQIPRT